MRRNQRQRISRVQAGVILVVASLVVTYFGFTKAIPFRQHFEIKADFKTSNNLRVNSPVRIAGVDVGTVTKVEPLREGEEGARVTMRIEERGRPLHKDATIQIRPRIFLEGNFFLDVRPGSPSAAKLDDDDVIPASQTSTPVQIDQILTALQSDTRRDLQVLLQELSTGFSGRGALGFNKSIQYWEDAFRGGAVVNEATLGVRRHDLSDYVKHAGTVAGALDRDPEALKSLVTDFNTTAAAFAREQAALEQTVAELPRTLRAAQPALAALNESFPPLRRLVADLRPAVRSSGPALEASLPFVRQARSLVGRPELRGLTADLRPLVPDLARLTRDLVPLYQQVRLASSCQNDVILPWSRMTTPDPNFPASGKVYQESVMGFGGLAGESRSGDANGQWARVLGQNGLNVYAMGQAADGARRVGLTNFPIQGVNPPVASRPQSRYDVPCETQEPPDLRTIPGQPPEKIEGASQTPRQAALNRANQYEGAAEALRREGHPKRAARFYAQARALRARHDLLGKQWDIVRGHLEIVDAGAKRLTPGGAPPVAPFALRGKGPEQRAKLHELSLRATEKLFAKAGDGS